MANEKFKEAMKYAGVGAGVALGMAVGVLKFVSGWLSKSDYVKVDLQSAVDVKVTGLSSVVNPGLGDYFKQYLAKLTSVAHLTWADTFLPVVIGGALAGLVGYFGLMGLDKLGLKIKNATGRLATAFLLSGIFVGWMMAWKFSVPALSAIIPTAIASVILAIIVQFLLVVLTIEKSM
jgi:hypothetical protein